MVGGVAGSLTRLLLSVAILGRGIVLQLWRIFQAACRQPLSTIPG